MSSGNRKPGDALIALAAEHLGYGMCCMHYECEAAEGCPLCSAVVDAVGEIERLRARVKELELDVEASEADRHFHDDFYTPPESDDD